MPLRRAAPRTRASPWVAGTPEPRDGCCVSQTSLTPSSSAGDLLAHRQHILVVEDDELSLDIIMRWLGRRGYTNVRGVVDGPTGLAACFQQQPDLLLLDHRLPCFSGLAIAEHLRMNFPRGQRPWTVLFTAVCNTNCVQLMGTGNFDDILRKPCVGADYVDMLARARGGLQERRIVGASAGPRAMMMRPRVAL